jgi:hypothetical protein
MLRATPHAHMHAACCCNLQPLPFSGMACQWEGAEGMAAAAADFNLNQGLVLQAGSLHCTVHSQAGWKTVQPIAHSL